MCQPIRLTIKNFGPIKEGDFVIDKYTVLIGDQGSGKSTVAKLYSLFTWLEKSLIRGTLSFQDVYADYQVFNRYSRIGNYYQDNTELYYDGLCCQFLYKENRLLKITDKLKGKGYLYKVMYVPAERNILSVMDRASKAKGWPDSLASFLDVLEESKQKYKELPLPLHSSLHFEYDNLDKISWLKGKDYKVRLTDASSGYQSLVPLCLVTHYLTALVNNTSNADLSVEDKRKLQKEVDDVMARTDLSDDVKNAMLQNISSKYKYHGFVNVVEEMEQNLYPQSQKDVLYYLIGKCNTLDANRLMLTTHSPYLINYLSLATKANTIWEKMPEDENLRQRLETIVPRASAIDISQLAIYELSYDGTSKRLSNANDYPTDNNFLNNLLGETNDLFNDLLDIEELCQA